MVAVARMRGFAGRLGCIAAVVAAALALATGSQARIIRVPAEVATIQGGLNLALDGDTVLVDHGSYAENLLWPPTQDIKLYANEQAPPESTIISGALALLPAIRFDAGVTTGTEIRGFIVQDGSGESGAGICCSGGASPTISRNLIRNNTASLRGGGIYLGPASTAVVEGNTIEWNAARDGGGIYSDIAFPTIRANRIRNNEVSNGIGGGVHIEYGAAAVERNKITYNRTMYEAAGLYACGDDSRIEFNNISFNFCFTPAPGGGVFT